MSSPDQPLLLDTHYWIWLQLGATEQFTGKVLKRIEEAARLGNVFLSVISVWELGMLEAKGRIRLHCPCDQWVKEALQMPGLSLAPFTPEIAVDSSRLPGKFHGDPADRMIVATARRMRARLVTRDERLLDYASQQHLDVL